MKKYSIIIADVLIACGLIGSALKGLISWPEAVGGIVLSLKPSVVALQAMAK